MPEVIEVRQYTDFFNKKIKNKKLLGINIVGGRYKKHGPFDGYDELIKEMPLTIHNIGTKGKYMYIELSNSKYIGVTLGLSGGWFFKSNSGRLTHGIDTSRYMNDFDIKRYQETALKHVNVIFKLDIGEVFFYDQLSFGTISVLTKDEVDKKLKTLGLDLMDESTAILDFKSKLNSKTNENKPIGNVLMNQKLFSGIGNYLRADILWLSNINPFKKVKELTERNIEDIFNNIKILIWIFYNYDEGIKKGIIPKGYKTPWDYDRDFFIYMQKTDINGNKVKKEKLYEGSQVRYIYWVSETQS